MRAMEKTGPDAPAGRRRRQRGSALLEGAFVFLPLCAILFAIIDFSMAIFLRATFQNAVREGVRYAVTYQTQSGMCQDGSIKAQVKLAASGFLENKDSLILVKYYNPGDLSTEVTGSGSNAPGNVVEVSVSNYNYGWMAPLLRTASPLVITVESADRMEGLPPGVAPPCR